ncbi:MAG: peptide chain release factor N(5)-glutamine methyltransferase [Clostridia bacterium]|nr:peptide chain release factor N(5)-glutamine methyltransferase [Clostridia bacterium]
MVKTIFDALTEGTKILEKSNIESYISDAKILLCHILKKDKSYLTVHKTDEIKESDYNKYIELIKMRSKKTPVKYLTGVCEFYSLQFKVNSSVLIPRPDTEIIIDTLIDKIDKECSLSILDLCTGSGCIGITLATIFKNSNVTLVDISDEALDVCSFNVLKHNINDRAKIIKKDILNDTIDKKYDLIVSNPPYINEDDFLGLEDDVKKYEPFIALVSPDDEYKFYKRIIDDFYNNLNDGGYMLLEMGINQWKYLYDYAIKSNKFKSVEIIKDLAKIERVLCLKK